MAGLCEGGNEPSGSLKAICKCSANDKSALYRYKTSANDKSALYRYKTASIDYSRICNRKRISEKSRRLEIQYCRRSRIEEIVRNYNQYNEEGHIRTYLKAISYHLKLYEDEQGEEIE
ncbi:hypothetical protein ANN_14925 [Periplaneta americana]|uniref:Uncharacterized protein n=1 Tax=Periplaneta americana TaxID=6978 RepID=A0ABQ8SXQ8_PERAM|nr:hypothetical protein ANN_14925 [Periplaneta americana]